MKHLDYDHEVRKIDSAKKLRELYADYILLIRETLTKFNDEKNPEYYRKIYQNLLQEPFEKPQ